MANKEHDTVSKGSTKHTINWRTFIGRIRDLMYEEEKDGIKDKPGKSSFEQSVGDICKTFIARKGRFPEDGEPKKDGNEKSRKKIS